VDVFDLLILLGAWGPCFFECPASIEPEVQDCLNKYGLGTKDLIDCLDFVSEFGEFYPGE
jgi:hypothetical protein